MHSWRGVLLFVAGWLVLAGRASGQAKTAEGSSNEAVLAYRDAANFQNNGAFEVAVEEWQKFLKDYGSDPWPPRRGIIWGSASSSSSNMPPRPRRWKRS